MLSSCSSDSRATQPPKSDQSARGASQPIALTSPQSGGGATQPAGSYLPGYHRAANCNCCNCGVFEESMLTECAVCGHRCCQHCFDHTTRACRRVRCHAHIKPTQNLRLVNRRFSAQRVPGGASQPTAPYRTACPTSLRRE